MIGWVVPEPAAARVLRLARRSVLLLGAGRAPVRHEPSVLPAAAVPALSMRQRRAVARMDRVDRVRCAASHAARHRGAGLHDPRNWHHGSIVGQVDVAAEDQVGTGFAPATDRLAMAAQQVVAFLGTRGT